jgi:hypothetical protein
MNYKELEEMKATESEYQECGRCANHYTSENLYLTEEDELLCELCYTC